MPYAKVRNVCWGPILAEKNPPIFQPGYGPERGTLCVQKANTSSMHLHHTRGSLFWVCRNCCSNFPMNKLVYSGAITTSKAKYFVFTLHVV